MIFLTTRDHQFTIEEWLARRGAADVAARTRLIAWESLPRLTELPRTTVVFTDHERLRPAQMRIARSLWRQLQDAGVATVNDPSRVLCRAELLAALHEQGINSFRAWSLRQALQPDSPVRWPVFIRPAAEHSGALSPLLHNISDLRRGLREVLRAGRFRTAGLLAMEWLDASDAAGMYHKYSIVRIGRPFVPRYLNRSRHWMIKNDYADLDESHAAAERRYVMENPHEAQVREIFDLAGIEYGRMDYAVIDGRLQVWEINTNPTMGPSPGQRRHSDAMRHLLEPTKLVVHRQFNEAFRELDQLDSGGPRDSPVRLRWSRSDRQAALRDRVSHWVGELPLKLRREWNRFRRRRFVNRRPQQG